MNMFILIVAGSVSGFFPGKDDCLRVATEWTQQVPKEDPYYALVIPTQKPAQKESK